MKKEFIKDNIGALITHILVYLKGIFLIPIIIKTVGVSIYGSFSLLTSFVGIIYGLSALGVGVKSYRYLPSAKTNNDRAGLFYPPFYFQLMMIVFISLLILLSEKQILNFVSDDEMLFSIYIIPIYLLLYSLYVHSSNFLRYTSRILYMNILGLAFAYGHVFFILFYTLYIGKVDINILFLSQAFVALLVSLPFLVLLFKELNFKFIFFKIEELKERIKIGFPLVLNFIVDFILAASDRFILAYFMGVFAVGLYVPAYTVGSLILLVPKAIGTVVPQLISKSIDNGDFQQAKDIFTNSLKVFIVVAVPFIFGIHLISNDFLILLANEKVAAESRYITIIIAISSLFYGLTILISQIYFVELKTTVVFKANLIASLLNLFLNIVFLFFIESIYIPAFTTVLSFMVAYKYFYKNLDRKWIENSGLLNFFLKICFLSILMALMVSVTNFFELTGIVAIILKVLLALFVYAFLIILFKIYSKEQILSIKRLLFKNG